MKGLCYLHKYRKHFGFRVRPKKCWKTSQTLSEISPARFSDMQRIYIVLFNDKNQKYKFISTTRVIKTKSSFSGLCNKKFFNCFVVKRDSFVNFVCQRKKFDCIFKVQYQVESFYKHRRSMQVSSINLLYPQNSFPLRAIILSLSRRSSLRWKCLLKSFPAPFIVLDRITPCRDLRMFR